MKWLNGIQTLSILLFSLKVVRLRVSCEHGEAAIRETRVSPLCRSTLSKLGKDKTHYFWFDTRGSIHPIPIWPTTLGRDWARSWCRGYWGNILESKLRYFDLSCENVVFIYTILRYIYILSTCLQAIVFLNVTNRVLPRQQGKSVVFLLSKPAFTKKAVDSRHSPRRRKKLQDFLKREDKLPLGVSLTSRYFLDLTSRCLLRMSSKLRPLPAKGYMSRELSSR